jgi:hypothetical protein
MRETIERGFRVRCGVLRVEAFTDRGNHRDSTRDGYPAGVARISVEATPRIPPHGILPASVERDLHSVGFTVVSRDDRFIDRDGEDDVWWIIVARKP